MTKKKFKNVFNNAKNLYEGRELVINAFRSGLFRLKPTTGTGLDTKTNASKITNCSCTSKSWQ